MGFKKYVRNLVALGIVAASFLKQRVFVVMLLLWSYVVMELCCYGVMLLWGYVVMGLCCYGVMLLWCDVVMLLWSYIVMMLTCYVVLF